MESHDREGVDGTIGVVEDYSPLLCPDFRLPARAMFAELDVPEEA
jgi:hypothetical protein